MLHELARQLRTIRYLRASQIRGQLWKRVRPGVRALPARTPLPHFRARAAVPFLPAPAHARFRPPATFRMLQREVCFPTGIDWNHAGAGPLWRYHLNQFDYLRDPALDAAARLPLILDWIDRYRGGAGWDPHPTSLRTFAWTKLLLTPGALAASTEQRRRIEESLAGHARTLAANLETHILANHYLSNLLAVVLAGVAFEGTDSAGWRAHRGRLWQQLDEQLGADGAHVERSPMYHALLLESILDLLNVARGTSALDAEDETRLSGAAERMLGALRLWTLPDGEIALFADSALGIAPPPPALEAYAASLGLEAQQPARAGVLDSVGYVRLERPPLVVLVSVAGPMPSYQPGHAHCDALAFEMCVDRERVVTDTGVSEYVPGPLRDWSRATRAHATLEVGGEEQAECWAGHRVGGRPRVACVSVEPGRRVEALCAGWRTPDTLHRRSVELDEEGLTIRDRLEGRLRPVRMALPLAPGLRVELEGTHARVGLRSGSTLEVALPDSADWKLEQAPYFPEFGRVVERPLLVGQSESLREGRWRFRLR